MANCVSEKNSKYAKSLLENQQRPKMGHSHISNECHTDNFYEYANISHLPREPQTSSAHILNKSINSYQLAQWHLMLSQTV